jgi:hypothetical protein
MAYAGYIRISDVAGRNGDSFISPAVQRETIEGLAQARGVELAEVIDERAGNRSRSMPRHGPFRMLSRLYPSANVLALRRG